MPRITKTAEREALVIEALEVSPATLSALASRLRLPCIRVRYTLDVMRRQGRAHISEWVPARGRQSVKLVPVYRLGDGAEVACPTRKAPGLDFSTGAHLTQLSVLWIVK